jgi:3-hydroxyisobutyrate dehydrogenase-like beta-hydroxyacid dehydrogenase
VDAPVSGGVVRAGAGDVLIRSNAYPAPLASAAEQPFVAGRRAGLGRLDDSSVIQVLRGELTSRPAETAS